MTEMDLAVVEYVIGVGDFKKAPAMVVDAGCRVSEPQKSVVHCLRKDPVQSPEANRFRTRFFPKRMEYL